MSTSTPSSSSSPLSSFTPTVFPPQSQGAKSQPPRTTKETHPNLPPGLILDEQGNVCKVCNSWQDWARVKVKKKGEDGQGPEQGKGKVTAGGGLGGMGGFAAMMGGSGAAASSSKTSQTAGPSVSVSAPIAAAADRSDCPPDTAALGRSTWTFLHTTAAYYPLTASPTHQTNMRSLLSSLSILYPCGWCADDFRKDMEANPPDLSGREGLSRWLCLRHNEVNDKLGKGKFECTEEKLGERWRDGPKDGRCD